jgi:hypothetical protein
MGCTVPKGMQSVYSCPSKAANAKCLEMVKEVKIYGCLEKMPQ